jgi:hypothetical protein
MGVTWDVLRNEILKNACIIYTYPTLSVRQLADLKGLVFFHVAIYPQLRVIAKPASVKTSMKPVNH